MLFKELSAWSSDVSWPLSSLSETSDDNPVYSSLPPWDLACLYGMNQDLTLVLDCVMGVFYLAFVYKSRRIQQET